MDMREDLIRVLNSQFKSPTFALKNPILFQYHKNPLLFLQKYIIFVQSESLQ